MRAHACCGGGYEAARADQRLLLRLPACVCVRANSGRGLQSDLLPRCSGTDSWLQPLRADTALRDNNMRLKFLTGERLRIVVAIQGLSEPSPEVSPRHPTAAAT